jgi:very-short-patch-repair endonuclease
MGGTMVVVLEGGRNNEQVLRYFAQAPIDEAIASLGIAQHGVFALSQVTAVGLTARAVQQRAARSRLHRIHDGVYSLVPRELLTRRGHWMAAVLAGGSGAVLSHRTAAALHGIRDTARTNIEVTVLGRSRTNRRGIDIHRATILTPADITVVDNIPCTSVARTKLDLAEVVSYRSLERAFDESEARELFDLHAINDQLARNPTRPAAAIVKRLLEEHYVGSTLTESMIEEAFYAICQSYRLPKPQFQQWIDLEDDGPLIRVDFVWRPQRVIVEPDGARFHGTAQARERDPRRDQRATVAGWRPIRTTTKQIFRRPHELGPTLVRLVGASG